MKISVKFILTLVCSVAFSHAVASTGDQDALMAVTHDLCPRQVAMLGESNTHGDGHTEAFKVALVQRLVNECGFDMVLFEANHYEFLAIARRLRAGQDVSTDQIATAVGGLWKFDREFQPILPFLLEKAKAGRIVLGGIDDQLGQMGQDYANVEMVAELTALLPPARRTACSVAMHKRIYSDYTAADHAEVATCLAELQPAIAADKTTDLAGREDRQEMVANFERWIGRDSVPAAEQNAGRDKSMFQNFEWLRRQNPLRRKVIVWAATVHIAKQSASPTLDRKAENFGSYVHQEYGERAFSLGFSALGGSYRQGRNDVHPMPAAPPQSMEAQGMQGSALDAVYVGPAQLTAMGTVPAAALRHSFQTLPWASLLDGLVVFREERPPVSTR